MWRPENKQFRIENKDTHAEIWMYDEIGVWGVTAKSFADELKAAGDVKSLTLRLNSPGGDVFDGLAIYNTLLRHPANVSVEIDGVAASIASIIAMAGDTIAISPNAMVMIHDPWTVAMGGAEDFRKSADLLDQVKTSLVSTYQSKTGQSAAAISDKMSEETWFEAQEAIDFGLADVMTDAAAITASAVTDLRNQLVDQYGNRSVPQEGTPERSEWMASRDYAIKLAGVV
jgi:ATP-dependent Clp endopeptidase proteolytic subunit ClpP